MEETRIIYGGPTVSFTQISNCAESFSAPNLHVQGLTVYLLCKYKCVCVFVCVCVCVCVCVEGERETN